MVIEFLKEDGSRSRFLTGVTALETLMNRLMVRMVEAVKETRWTEIEQPDSLMDCIDGSIEEEFPSSYCLISGIGQKQVMLQGNAANLDKLVTAVAGLDNMEIESDYLSQLREGKVRPIRSQDLGWERMMHDRAMYLIQLKTPVIVGRNLVGDIPIYRRHCTSESVEGQGLKGEWVIRQLLRMNEADAIRRVVESERGYDVGVVMIRGLTKVTVIDEAILRWARKYYRDKFKAEVSATYCYGIS